MDTLTYKKSNSPPSVGTTPKRPIITNFTHSNQVSAVLGRAPIQAKLKISAPNDKYEQEADRVADRVMSMPDPALQRQPMHTALANQFTPLVQRKTEPEEGKEEAPEKAMEEALVQAKAITSATEPTIQRQLQPEEKEEAEPEREEESVQAKAISNVAEPLIQRQLEPEEEAEAESEKEEEPESIMEEMPIQTKRFQNESLSISTHLNNHIQSLKGTGQPLPANARMFFEPRFGQDFRGVKVHTGPNASELATALNAKAFTSGKNIVFQGGYYSPDSNTGKRLLAHELTHVVQQKQHKYQQNKVFQNCARLTPCDKSNIQNTRHINRLSPIENRIQRKIGMEFQTANKLKTSGNKTFPRKAGGGKGKYGKYFHKDRTTGVELQTDTNSVLEFVTDPFTKWSDLKKQIYAAKLIVDKIKAKPDDLMWFEVRKGRKWLSTHRLLRQKRILGRNEKLKVLIRDPSFRAAVQFTVGVSLEGFGSLLKQYERSRFLSGTQTSATRILQKFRSVRSRSHRYRALLGFIQLIVNYIKRGQELDPYSRVFPAKAHFALMARRSFRSMYWRLLKRRERSLFRKIVNRNLITKRLRRRYSYLRPYSPFFKFGYWGHYRGKWVLFKSGYIKAVALPITTGRHRIIRCGRRRRRGRRRHQYCNRRFKGSHIRINKWLKSIYRGRRGGKNILSPPYRGSKSMGSITRGIKGPEKRMAIFEVRRLVSMFPGIPYTKWKDFSERNFILNTVTRPSSKLNYDGAKQTEKRIIQYWYNSRGIGFIRTSQREYLLRGLRNLRHSIRRIR